MLKIVYPICCGDVRKNFVVARIATTDARGVTNYKKKRFSTFNSDLRLFASGLAENKRTGLIVHGLPKTVYRFTIRFHIKLL